MGRKQVTIQVPQGMQCRLNLEIMEQLVVKHLGRRYEVAFAEHAVWQGNVIDVRVQGELYMLHADNLREALEALGFELFKDTPRLELGVRIQQANVSSQPKREEDF